MNETLIVIPAYNESKNIGAVLDRIARLRLDADVVVINDGSADDTEAIVKSKDINVISLPYNLGYGGALQTGFKYATCKGYQYVIQFDADGQHNADEIKGIMDCLKTTGADIVIGSRFIKGGHFNAGAIKKLGMGFLKFSIRTFTGKKVSDPTSGFKGLTKKIFSYYASSDNFSPDYPDADILIQVIRAGCSIHETPIVVIERNEGKSMHSGLKPIFYFVKFILNISVIMLREKVKGEVKL